MGSPYVSKKEFNEHVFNTDKEDRDERSILRCIEDEDGKPVFESMEQVKALYTNVRSELIGLVAQASLMQDPAVIENEVKCKPASEFLFSANDAIGA
nr:cytochrome [Escherichia coli]